jgi:hypothetical protein
MDFTVFYNGQEFVLFLVIIMITTNIIKENMLMIDLLGVFGKYIKNTKIAVFLTSMFFGILPIPGRIVLGSSMINSLSKEKMSYKIGVLEYLSTHHYYFWSPLEKTVIVPMSILGISYAYYISVVWPVILLSILFLAIYLWLFIKEEDINIKFPTQFLWKNIFLYVLPILIFILIIFFTEMLVLSSVGLLLYYSFMVKLSFEDLKRHINSINFKLIFLLMSTIVIGNIIKESGFNIVDQKLLISALIVSFVYSFLLGSSSKYAMISALLISAFGLEYMLLFLVVDFAGYILSPTHKCFWVALSYYEIQVKKFVFVIVLWLSILLFYSIIQLLL